MYDRGAGSKTERYEDDVENSMSESYTKMTGTRPCYIRYAVYANSTLPDNEPQESTMGVQYSTLATVLSTWSRGMLSKLLVYSRQSREL